MPAAPSVVASRRAGAAAVVAVLLVALLPLGGARAGAAELTVTGAGYGHQVGMSQYGALGAARAGGNHRLILGHYYPGTTLGRRDAGFPIRVGVGRDDRAVRLTARAGPARVRGHGDLRRLAAGRSMRVTTRPDGRCRVRAPGHDLVAGCPRLDPAPSARIQVRSRTASGSYGRRATVEVVSDRTGDGRRLDTVVSIPLEQYLYGLAEVPYSWHPQALKAQVVAARSYALWRMLDVGRAPDRGCSCHVLDSQQDQVYRGREREVGPGWSRWRAAVDDTARRVVLARGAAGTRDGVAQTFYSSSSSGRTASNGEVWGGTTRSWLRPVDDPWTRRASPWVPWTRRVDDGALRRALRLGRVDRVVVTRRTDSRRVAEVRVDGRRGGRDVSVRRDGEWLRRTLGLPSSTVRRVVVPGRRDVRAGSPEVAPTGTGASA